jgi:hypothetical protein
MRLYHFLRNRWWLTYGLGLAFAIFYIVMQAKGEPNPEADTIIYTQVILRGMGFFPVLPTVTLLFVGTIFLTRSRKDLDHLLLVMTGLPVLFTFATWFQNQPTICDTRVYTLDTVSIDGRIYALSRFCTSKVAIFECDSLMVVCNTIHRGAAFISRLEFERTCVGDDARTHLAVDNQTLLLISGCEALFSYHPP